MKNVLQRLGRPDSINWVSLVFIVLFQTAGSLAISQVNFSDRLIEFLAIREVSFLAMFAILGIGKLILSRYATERPLPWVTVITFLLGITASTTVFDALLVATQLTETPQLGSRLVVSLIPAFVALAIAGLIVSYSREFHRNNTALRSALSQLVETRHEATERIRLRQEQLLTRVKTLLNDELSGMGPTNLAPSSQDMKHLLDDVIRPLSYQLERDVETASEQALSEPNKRLPWFRIVSHTLSDNPIRPIATALWLSFFTAVFFIKNYGSNGLIIIVAILVSFIGVLWAARKAWDSLPITLGATVRALIFSTLLATAAFVSAGFMSAVSSFDMFTLDRILPWLIESEIVPWTLALLAGTQELQRKTNQELQVTVDELRREVISLNAAYRQLQRNMSRVLHGPIQNAIATAIYRLQLSTKHSDDAAIIAEAKARIASSLDQLSLVEVNEVNLSESLAELTELWEGVIRLSVIASETDLNLIDTDKATASGLHELVTEACTNAIRHGEAQNINVSITVNKDQGTIALIVENDGHPLDQTTKKGLGSQLLEEMTLAWSRVQEGKLVRLEATIPLNR